jgi:alginate O-acetyltransferase complex protein AlgI
MLFCSRQFLCFFLAVFTLYWLLPRQRLRTYLLLVASYAFYACWSQWLALLIAGSTVVDYLVGRGMDASRSALARRLLLAVSLVLNLGVLITFKYANFFLDSLGQALRAAGLEASLPTLSVLLPIGISFYTFEAINYTVDVYRRRIAAEKDLAHFMLFVLFFPHLVAGPIVRARDFLPQIRRRKRWSWPRMQMGVQFFLLGLVKKLAVADRMALYADPVFAQPELYRTGALWVAVLAYALQIYGDFSGYSDMAIGCAHMLGYKLARNFDLPYLASSISEFWRRWHISLSTWLRDYLFIPLGGSRGGTWQTCRNLMLTMTLGGLWHGASWTFVVWGFLHGLLLVGHRLFGAWRQDRPLLSRCLESRAGAWACGALTFSCVALLWVFFRAPTFACALDVLAHLFVPRGGESAPMHDLSLWLTAGLMLACHLLERGGWWKRLFQRLPEPALGFGYAAALALALLLTPEVGRTFIYFQF